MSERTKVSVIVPAYNYAHFLPDALDSLIAQTFGLWECVVVDDGSTDATSEVAESYTQRDSRIRLLRQHNRGLAAARNAGIAATTAPFVQFLDADDRIHSRKLERQVAFLEAHSETDIVYGEATFFRTEAPQVEMKSMHGKLSRSLMPHVHGADEALAKLELYNIMPVHAALVRRSVFERAGTFDEGAPACEDWAFWIRAAVAGCRFDFEPGETVAFVRSHSTSMSRSAERIWRGVVFEARCHEESASGRLRRTPRIYSIGLAIELAEHGHRLAAFLRMWRAASGAELLTSMRWRFYAFAALALPVRWMWRVLSLPMPERGLELYRRLRSRRRTSS
jgi:glycosyltransferase involved in cell wall biosynthesis